MTISPNLALAAALLTVGASCSYDYRPREESDAGVEGVEGGELSGGDLSEGAPEEQSPAPSPGGGSSEEDSAGTDPSPDSGSQPGFAITNPSGPFPAESRTSAQSLFVSGSAGIQGQDNWSGAYWSSENQTLWLCRNKHGFRSYRFDGESFALDGDYRISADFEGITQVNPGSREVYVLAENDQELHRYEASSGQSARLLQIWDLSDLVASEEGLEGLTFVPDAFLQAQGFRQQDGGFYGGSEGGLGGLMMLSFQEGGDIFALDLDAGRDDFVVVGRYRAPTPSTRGLEFDRLSGLLFMVDATNVAAVALSTTGQGFNQSFDIAAFYNGPGPAGAEGLAIDLSASPAPWAIITDDDNSSGNTAVLWYRQFRP